MIAFHDVNDSNGPALPQIIDYLYANGYEFVTVSDLIFPVEHPPTFGTKKRPSRLCNPCDGRF